MSNQLPFGVGGGLVAIKTLLSRDPCAHANLAIEMIDAILAEHPTQVDIRNATLEEIATKIGKMPFGDTAASFAVWIREQKTKTYESKVAHMFGDKQ